MDAGKTVLLDPFAVAPIYAKAGAESGGKVSFATDCDVHGRSNLIGIIFGGGPKEVQNLSNMEVIDLSTLNAGTMVVTRSLFDFNSFDHVNMSD